MAESTTGPEYFFLPAEVWLRIAVYLDAESLQALQESDVVPWGVCDEPTLSRTTTLSPHSDASALQSYLLRCGARTVRTLRLTGCLTAAPDKLFHSISVCAQLVELYCVNCTLSPLHLFDIVSTSLPGLTRLEWSLFEQNAYRERLDDPFEYRVLPKLRDMYVEVAGEPVSCALLERLLQCCLNLERLHVHTLHKKQCEVLSACWNLDDPDRMLLSFAYTSQELPENLEVLLTLTHRLRTPIPFLSLSSVVFGNVTYRMHPTISSTCVNLKDVIDSAELAVPDEQLILCVECRHHTLTQLAEVADRPWLRRLRSLTFVLFPSRLWTYTGCRCHYISPAWSLYVRRFLVACANLTELNLSLVHFDRGTDFGWGLPSPASLLLRAVALPQCGLQTTESVNRLAASCAMLEELHVLGKDKKSSGDSWCPVCTQNFTAMNRTSGSALHRNTRLQRLTLDCFYGLQCYSFLAECSLVRLRLHWPKMSMTCCDGRSFFALLRSSEHLRSLTLNCPYVSLREICSELGNAGMLGLRNLCIVSGVEPRDCAQETICDLTRHASLLESVHAHYLDEDLREHRVTWLRRWSLGFSDLRADGGEGAFCRNVLCSPDCFMTTFIGLKKPRH